ncbi:hypothetical protein WS62_04595 [Burkholderia sp. ABCPW 14]|nr:hypothetical protein WS62_04595 [Burkholderia sp. ABCPW 14]
MRKGERPVEGRLRFPARWRGGAVSERAHGERAFGGAVPWTLRPMMLSRSIAAKWASGAARP